MKLNLFLFSIILFVGQSFASDPVWLTIDLSSKKIVSTNVIAIRETVPVRLVNIGAAAPSNMVLRITDNQGLTYALRDGFTTSAPLTVVRYGVTNVYSTATGSIDLNTDEFVSFFSNRAPHFSRAFTVGVWDGGRNRLLAADNLTIRNNPYQDGMPGPTPIGTYYLTLHSGSLDPEVGYIVQYIGNMRWAAVAPTNMIGGAGGVWGGIVGNIFDQDDLWSNFQWVFQAFESNSNEISNVWSYVQGIASNVADADLVKADSNTVWAIFATKGELNDALSLIAVAQAGVDSNTAAIAAISSGGIGTDLFARAWAVGASNRADEAYALADSKGTGTLTEASIAAFMPGAAISNEFLSTSTAASVYYPANNPSGYVSSASGWSGFAATQVVSFGNGHIGTVDGNLLLSNNLSSARIAINDDGSVDVVAPAGFATEGEMYSFSGFFGELFDAGGNRSSYYRNYANITNTASLVTTQALHTTTTQLQASVSANASAITALQGYTNAIVQAAGALQSNVWATAQSTTNVPTLTAYTAYTNATAAEFAARVTWLLFTNAVHSQVITNTPNWSTVGASQSIDARTNFIQNVRGIRLPSSGSITGQSWTIFRGTAGVPTWSDSSGIPYDFYGPWNISPVTISAGTNLYWRQTTTQPTNTTMLGSKAQIVETPRDATSVWINVYSTIHTGWVRRAFYMFPGGPEE